MEMVLTILSGPFSTLLAAIVFVAFPCLRWLASAFLPVDGSGKPTPGLFNLNGDPTDGH
jgi:hypothetical protein